MRLTNEDVTLSREDYLNLVRAQEQAQRIISDRSEEIETNRRIQEWGAGKAIYYTKDGLVAMGTLVSGYDKYQTIQRPCSPTNRGFMPQTAFYEPPERRTYEWRGEHIMGKPVFHEV